MMATAANKELYQRLKEEGLMVGAVSRIFREKLAEARAEARRDIRDILIAGGMSPQELQERLTAGGMAPQEAARYMGLSPVPSPSAGFAGARHEYSGTRR